MIRHRKPRPKIAGDCDAFATTGTTYYLSVKVPLVSGHPAAGVPLAEHKEGLALAGSVIELLPNAGDKTVAWAIVCKALEAARHGASAGELHTMQPTAESCTYGN